MSPPQSGDRVVYLGEVLPDDTAPNSQVCALLVHDELALDRGAHCQRDRALVPTVSDVLHASPLSMASASSAKGGA